MHVVQQQSSPVAVAKSAPSKGFGKSGDKHKTLKVKEKVKETQNQPDEPVVMEDEFDRLLVSDLHIFFRVGIYALLFTRMAFRFPRLCDRNWQQWTQLSKRLCLSLLMP